MKYVTFEHLSATHMVWRWR